MSNQHGLSSDMRRYRLTLNEINDVSWRSIHYIRPHQKLREVIKDTVKFLIFDKIILFHCEF